MSAGFCFNVFVDSDRRSGLHTEGRWSAVGQRRRTRRNTVGRRRLQGLEAPGDLHENKQLPAVDNEDPLDTFVGMRALQSSSTEDFVYNDYDLHCMHRLRQMHQNYFLIKT